MKNTLAKSKYLIVVLTLFILVAAVAFSAVGVAFAGTYSDPDVPKGLSQRDYWYFAENRFDLAGAREYFSTFDFSENEQIYIAVIDTGINYNHELFEKTLLWVEENGIRKPVGYNSVTKDGNIGDSSSSYHGTHVAGIIASVILELGIEDYVKIIPIKAVNSSNQFTSTAVNNAIKWACGENTIEQNWGYKVECRAINMSISVLKSQTEGGSWADTTALQSTIDKYSDTAVFVSAAGNNGVSSVEDPTYPASLDNVISVMNYSEKTADELEINSGSNYGYYDLAAPGTNIYSASGANYAYSTGTSMAAPFVSTAAIMLALRYPSVTASKLSLMLLNHQSSITIEKEGINHKGVDVMSILQTDFLSDDIYEYVKPSSISISASDESLLNQRAEEFKTIPFTASIYPSDSYDRAYDSQVIWVVERTVDGKTEEIGRYKSGLKFSFDERFYGQQLSVYALLYVEGNSLTSEKTSINITYSAPDFQSIYISPVEWTSSYKGNGGDVPANVGTPLYLSFTSVKNVDPSYEVKWYVDGKLVKSGTLYDSKVFEYVPDTMGYHTITATIDGGWIYQEFKIFVQGPFAIGYVLAILAVAAFVAFMTVTLLAELKNNPFTPKAKRIKKSENKQSLTSETVIDEVYSADNAEGEPSGESDSERENAAEELNAEIETESEPVSEGEQGVEETKDRAADGSVQGGEKDGQDKE